MAKTNQRARIGRVLLALCGHRAGEPTGLSDADWRDLDALADQHRLRPFLHGRLARREIGGVPDHIAEVWREAHRANAITALTQRRALLQAVGLLAVEGIDVVVLKGAVLAWTVWPAPAEREMRDIDVLVRVKNAPHAYNILRDAGWAGPAYSAAVLGYSAFRHAHLPPLHSPEGVMCEVHGHIWGSAPLPGASMPSANAEDLFGKARRDERLGAKLPSAEDMLVHLVVHAACSHLLNVGPIALVDIDLWSARHEIDWQAFWERAEAEGFTRPAALLFALIERWRKPGFLAETSCPLAISEDLLADTELLLVQDLDARKDVSAIASLASGRIGGRLEQHPLDRAENKAGLARRAAQVTGRALSIARSLFAPGTRRDGIATARLQKWMEG